MIKIPKEQIIGLLLFIFVFIYSIILEIKHFGDVRIKARIELFPYIIIGIILFLGSVYLFNKKK